MTVKYVLDDPVFESDPAYWGTWVGTFELAEPEPAVGIVGGWFLREVEWVTARGTSEKFSRAGFLAALGSTVLDRIEGWVAECEAGEAEAAFLAGKERA